jgi:hypothetical protein
VAINIIDRDAVQLSDAESPSKFCKNFKKAFSLFGALFNVAMDAYMLRKLFQDGHLWRASLFLLAMLFPSLLVIWNRRNVEKKWSLRLFFLICHPINTIVFPLLNICSETSMLRRKTNQLFPIEDLLKVGVVTYRVLQSLCYKTNYRRNL